MRRATPRQMHLLQGASVSRLSSLVCVCAGHQSLHTLSQRPTVNASLDIELAISQKRCITQQNIRRQKEAEIQWKGFAEEIRAGKRKAFLDHLEERELVNQVVGPREVLDKVFTDKRTGLYTGIDPTAPSLHVGHMLPIMVLAWAFNWGYPIHFILGGATARFGDPTGRLGPRQTEHRSVRTANMASMHMQLKRISASIEDYGRRHGYKKEWAWRRALTNNNVWWNGTPFVEVLRDLGMHMRLGPMLGRDTVKTRLEGNGMSFAEFSYPLMQAWDWWELFKKGVQVQVGGSDQFGNILFGMEAVKQTAKNTAIEIDRRPVEEDADKPAGLTTPLLTTSSGEKIGKSAGNAVWLDKDMTSTFELYQYFVRTPDDQVERYLKMFTFLPLDKITQLMEETRQDPSKRVAQHALAREFVDIVHGPIEAEAAATQHRQLFRPRSSISEPTPPPTQPSNIPPHLANDPKYSFMNRAAGNKFAKPTNYKNMESNRVTLPRSLVLEQPLAKVLYNAGLVVSNSEGHRLIVGKGVSVGSRPGDSGQMSDALEFTPIKTWVPAKTPDFLIDGNLLIIKIGKWKLKLIELIDDEEFDKRGLDVPGWAEFKEKKAAGQITTASQITEMPETPFRLRKYHNNRESE
ncbi:tyrosyl-tRNA synthetase, mitochondrial precursor (tyrosine--tRNA ligase) (tyrrs) [Talaromyces stipitatus ATCC 10500]|uniref:Tyrosine--tRNA ligase n=1 Tax=Talaromyces stipitatus (strain ATCC 10500 / CBS 375.48 / QM 6759 / NRRL 1006) TaxID=441959 RepID=B8M8A0_TALSN|nr:tyrosyl-tRNA synthetase, mitochondrial precursor (tyrosine--tRNA ligase) (tyrrs) [Talaromyces stipitatus ATCC 10500]EED20413.1 tyrosyl-tRNA synthetase, mitochondrial precursor (tyrosine--tRNA ligase) (tyrrs) [Talaromyces stipitatus ATCC 10500]